MISFEWKDLLWILGLAGLLAGALISFVKFRLSGDFAKSSDIAALTNRLALLEIRLDRAPSHEDLKVLQARVGDLERGVAVVGEKVNGVGDILVRVERQVNLVSQHLIQEGR